MSDVDTLLADLRQRGIRLWAEDGRLRYRGPSGAMAPDLLAQLRGRKHELLSLLGSSTGAAGERPIPALDRREHYPLSHAQRRMWVLAQIDTGSAAYNIPLHQIFEGQLDRQALMQAIRAVIDRHESLRTTIVTVDGEPRQRVHTAIDFRLECLDLSDHSDPDAAAAQRAHQHAATPFDLERGPLLRVDLLQLAPRRHALLFTIHHIACDGVSIGILAKEVARSYQAFRQGKPGPLPPLRIQYRDFAAWQNDWLEDKAAAADRAWWHGRLAGRLPILNMPADFPRPPIQTFAGRELPLQLDRHKLDALLAFTRQHNVSLFMVLLAALKVLLHKYTGQQDLIVASPIAGRNHADLQDQVGLYLNMLALRSQIDGEQSFVDFLQQVRQSTLDAFDHQAYPFDRLVDELHVERDLSRNPLADVILILQNQDDAGLAVDDVAIRPFFDHPGTSKADLTFNFKQSPAGLIGGIEYNTDLFLPDRIARLGNHFEELLNSILAAPQTPIDRLNLLGAGERARVVCEFNDTSADYPRDKTVVDLIDRQAALTPGALAVEDEQTRLSYLDLQHHSDRFARQLQAIGVGPDHLVGICVERSPAMLVGLLGIWKAGAGYVPLDPDFPPQRLAMILEDCRPQVLVTQRPLQDRLQGFQGQVLDMDTALNDSVAAPDSVEPLARADNRAYVIYTSGSTGKPKGVEIPHRALVNFLLSMAQAPGFAASDVMLAVTTISFDIAALEMFLPLTCGGPVVIAPRAVAADGPRLIELLTESKATVMQATPATWRMLLAAGWQGGEQLKILCGGEGLPCELAGQLRRRGREVWNLYGPTETTIWSTVCDVTADPDAEARAAGEPAADRTSSRQDAVESIGQPIANTQVYVLDRRLQPQPIGVPGELYIGGDGLARGYFRRPDLTVERFIPHPLSDDPLARLYRTGDLARRKPDGNLEFLGRIDQQVKIRGFRVELEEIEAVLNQHPAVEQSVVVAEQDAAGDRRLVAWYVPHNGREAPVPQLREHARQTLPDYMVPSLFQKIDQLPLTPNGKVDRRALPASDRDRPELVAQYVAPRTEMQRYLVRLWCEVLELERVGIHDNFFELGGHSLKATMLAAQMQRELNLQLNLLDVFRHPTIAGLAESVAERDRTPGAEIRPLTEQPPIASDEIAPLSAEELEMLNE